LYQKVQSGSALWMITDASCLKRSTIPASPFLNKISSPSKGRTGWCGSHDLGTSPPFYGLCASQHECRLPLVALERVSRAEGTTLVPVSNKRKTCIERWGSDDSRYPSLPAGNRGYVRPEGETCVNKPRRLASSTKDGP
jgi:hypothetical protein